MVMFSGLNYVNVGPHGAFTASGHLTTSRGDIDAIFQHLANQGSQKLAIHFHGGLVDEGAGLDIARKMAPVYAEADCHPVTFVWETGLVETISRNLTRLHQTTLFRKLVAHVVRHVAKRLGGGIGGKGPDEAMEIQEIESELVRTDAFDRFDAGARRAAGGLNEAELAVVLGEIEAEVEPELVADDELSRLVGSGMAETEHLKPQVRQAMAPGAAKGVVEMATLAKAIASVALKVLRRYLKRTDHGLYPTVIEEILRELYLADFGAWVWGGMKDVAGEMWHPDHDHVGTYFLDKLSQHQQARSGFTVDLIGHSAGSIVICELFKSVAARRIPLGVRNVVFLAPACRSDLFLAEVVRQPTRYSAFRMFTMSDDFEKGDRLVPGVYTRSLLYFISGVLEDAADVPIAGLARHFSGEAPYNTSDLLEIRNWLLEAGTGRLVLAKTGAANAGFTSDASRHGDFDDDSPTRRSLVAILAA